MTKSTEEKILQAVNLSPDESMVEKLTEIHPMKQVAYASVIQVCVFGFMLLSFWTIHQFVQENYKMAMIYESPDKGKTVYAREIGAPIADRKQIKPSAVEDAADAMAAGAYNDRVRREKGRV